ncbi:hypothetical protein EUGRSUZ_A00573 [Eucalyptus grandis]|uniref:Uncharacterized protein n=2 Tax=Eucalyptus grandis TaxID=71139 RepID=A0ACC3M205_EUCGR|nr:hypothetical protein EUGRSUZ_A00573 [Eucalyptus grandis]
MGAEASRSGFSRQCPSDILPVEEEMRDPYYGSRNQQIWIFTPVPIEETARRIAMWWIKKRGEASNLVGDEDAHS